MAAHVHGLRKRDRLTFRTRSTSDLHSLLCNCGASLPKARFNRYYMVTDMTDASEIENRSSLQSGLTVYSWSINLLAVCVMVCVALCHGWQWICG